MAYTSKNYKTKAEIKRDLNAGIKIAVYEPGLGTIDPNGDCYLEGPHYPAPHRWYGKAKLKDGLVISIK